MTNQIIPDSFLNRRDPFAVSDLEKERVVEREAGLFLKEQLNINSVKNKNNRS